MNSAHPDRKQKIKHELREMLELFLYLAFFFCALAIYDMLLLKQYSVEYWTIAFALMRGVRENRETIRVQGASDFGGLEIFRGGYPLDSPRHNP